MAGHDRVHAAAVGVDHGDDRRGVGVLAGLFRDDVVQHARHLCGGHAGGDGPSPRAAQHRAQRGRFRPVAAHVADHHRERPVRRDSEVEEVAADAETLLTRPVVGDRTQGWVGRAPARQQALFEPMIEGLHFELSVLAREHLAAQRVSGARDDPRHADPQHRADGHDRVVHVAAEVGEEGQVGETAGGGHDHGVSRFGDDADPGRDGDGERTRQTQDVGRPDEAEDEHERHFERDPDEERHDRAPMRRGAAQDRAHEKGFAGALFPY